MGGDFSGKNQDCSKGIYALAGNSFFLHIMCNVLEYHSGGFEIKLGNTDQDSKNKHRAKLSVYYVSFRLSEYLKGIVRLSF